MTQEGKKIREGFSLRRAYALMKKEFIQLKRDKMTLRMIVMIPIIQILLFGYALNNDPKHLPTAVLAQDHSVFARSFVAGLVNTDYFAVTREPKSAAAAQRLLREGQVQFVVTIPENFGRDIVRGQKPQALIEADATDPTAISGPIAAAQGVFSTAFARDFTGPLAYLKGRQGSLSVEVHRMYNPEGFTRYNILPGLMGIILTMTGIMMTAMAITRERERGTMENLLSMPVRPLEVMIGKIMPYVLIGYIQAAIIVFLGEALFGVPVIGSLVLLSAVLVVFIACNLALGYLLSASAQNQTQAIQMSIMVLMPSILLSGFLFPFRGMPHWAQDIGSFLPATYFIRISRGILLKGDGFMDIWQNFWPLLAFMVVITVIATKRYRQTLD
ncbi:MAG: ABC transporter permease subunit [Alphaproteobacteria bacterium]|nr:ABC transporter permease subunit [Alphaproteobacteria bacterium]